MTTQAAPGASRDAATGTTRQWVYLADEAPAADKDLLGGKGAGLAAMTQAGLPVPAAFTITTAACNAYQDNGGQFPPGLWDQTLSALQQIEQKSGRTLGDASNPLLVSVRSGAKFSMPGMMDTVLNLGLNDDTVAGLARLTNNERFAWDAYRRFVQMFGRIVLGISGEKLDHVFDRRQAAARARHQSGIQLMDGQARGRLSQRIQDSARPGHGRQRGHDGLRKYGRRLGDGRRFYA
jgi:phosphoenolpyruvate synthase/pyruvate phosphate dikinase